MSQAPLQPAYTSQFKRDWKRCQKSHLTMDELRDIIEKLIKRIPLDPKNKDHQLGGNNRDFRECHIRPDWLLAYMIKGNDITFTRTGSHAELFGEVVAVSLGGNVQGRHQRRFYKALIKQADALYDRHLAQVAKDKARERQGKKP